MGYFSWLTQDTERSISNRESKLGTFEVHMINPKTSKVYTETNYDGYGRFDGKDYYELLAELNEDIVKKHRGTFYELGRSEGISLDFDDEYKDEDLLYPILVEKLDDWELYKGDKPINCPVQGYFYF